MTVRFAFVGFRHPHINDMYARCRERNDIEIVGCCEEDAQTRAELTAAGVVNITHDNFQTLLREVECEVIAVGDCYGRRAEIIEAALNAQRHVISDKPLCISLDELDRIECASQAAGGIVGCMLDMRDLAVFLGMREVIRSGRIGEVQALSFDGQHPLLYGQRPMWYFEKGMHGGVLNDIIVHAVDFISWGMGRQLQAVAAARCWNATVPQHPDFMQCGQAMLTLDNGAGVVCDVSYLTPDTIAYQMPLYWRFTVWGDQGVVEAAVNSKTITLYENGQSAAEELVLPAARPGAYLDAFLAEIGGQTDGLHLSSADALAAARISLLIQQAADENLHDVSLKPAKTPR